MFQDFLLEIKSGVLPLISQLHVCPMFANDSWWLYYLGPLNWKVFDLKNVKHWTIEMSSFGFFNIKIVWLLISLSVCCEIVFARKVVTEKVIREMSS